MSNGSQLFWKSSDPEAPLRAALATANARIQELPSQEWDPNTATIGGIRDYHLCCLAPDAIAWSSLLLHLNSELHRQLGPALFAETCLPVIAFYEYDQNAWGFAVFGERQAVDWFCNRPEVVEHDPYSCTVDPKYIADLFGVDAKAVAPYLKHLDPNADDPGKVFPEDEFSLGDHWVRCDFMRRLGLRYPNPGEPGTRHVYVKEPGVN